MGLLTNKLLWACLLGILLSGGLLLVLAGYLALVVYTGLVSGTPIVDVLVDVAVPALVGTSVLVVLLVVSVVGLLWTVVQNASVPRSERVASLVERVERELDEGGELPRALGDVGVEFATEVASGVVDAVGGVQQREPRTIAHYVGLMWGSCYRFRLQDGYAPLGRVNADSTTSNAPRRWSRG